MSSEFERRAAIIVALRAGRTPPEIADFLKLPKSTVGDVARRFFAAEESEEGSGCPERKKHVRDRPVRSPEMIERLQAMVQEDPGMSMRKMAAILQVSDSTVRKIVHEDLRYESYVLKIRQMLSEAMKKKRVDKCALLLTSLKHDASGRLRFFSDEKIFCVDAKVNRRNDRWLAQDPEDVPVIGKTKQPASVHVLGVVSSDGGVMPAHFFQKGQTVTKEVYLEVLQTVVKPWMVQVASGLPYIFQQDGAPAHTSNLVQNWLSDNLDMAWLKEFWPPSSPDLNPLDYYVWGVVERDANKTAHPNVDSLRTAVEQAMANLDRTHLKNACLRFRSRIEAVIEAEGAWIE